MDNGLYEEALECAEGVLVAERYRLVRKLGAGGMGSVWLSHDLALDSSCALKLIDEEKSQSSEVRVRFEREAKAAAQLRGAHVVDVFDYGEWAGVLYIAMEYLEGEDLGARLDRVGAIDLDQTYRIAAHVARALSRAHAYGIVHRDLKPENVFLIPSDEGEVAKVLDFGIAKHDAYSLQGKATRTGSFLGTPYYVSPEQARGKSTDHRSDLWSLGIIVFQCLTGRPPFESDALGELMGLILYEDLPRPTERNPQLPAAIDAWWERAASRDREYRFQTAKELVDALADALGIQTRITVQNVAPRRPNFADASGSYSASPPAGSNSRTPPGNARTPETAPHRVLVEPDSLEELVETDAPVSRTRHSDVGLSGAFSSPGWFSRLKKQRKRTLVTGAIGGGVALGVLLTWVVLGEEQRSAEAPPAGIERGVRTVEASKPQDPAPPTPAAPQRELQPLPTAAPAPEPHASAAPVPVESLEQAADAAAPPSPEPTGAARPTAEPRPRRAAPPRRRPARPDYGI